jgi:hypothetical protein
MDALHGAVIDHLNGEPVCRQKLSMTLVLDDQQRGSLGQAELLPFLFCRHPGRDSRTRMNRYHGRLSLGAYPGRFPPLGLNEPLPAEDGKCVTNGIDAEFVVVSESPLRGKGNARLEIAAAYGIAEYVR